MSAKPFLDTNILVYAFSTGDPRTGPARELVAGGGRISVQVLNEFVNVSRRKLGRDWQDILAFLSLVRNRLDEPSAITLETHRTALALADHHRLSVYDGLIVASAKLASCTTLYTEDLQHGRTIDTVRIVNPFAASAP